MELQLDTKPLLRPTQLADAKQELATLEKKLNNPLIQDKGEVAKQIRRLDASLNAQTPKPFVGAEKDAAAKMEAELREKILQGMPSHEEMRKAPPGALEKHQAWEAKHKKNLLIWKNLRLRLNAGSSDNSVANFEMFRPRTNSLNMDNAQIPGAQYFLPPPGVAPTVTFNDEEITFLKDVSPKLADKLALLSNEDRAEVKAALTATPKAA